MGQELGFEWLSAAYVCSVEEWLHRNVADKDQLADLSLLMAQWDLPGMAVGHTVLNTSARRPTVLGETRESGASILSITEDLSQFCPDKFGFMHSSESF